MSRFLLQALQNRNVWSLLTPKQNRVMRVVRCHATNQPQQNYPNKQTLSSNKEVDDEISNEPLQFFGSQAAEWRAKDSRSGGSDDYLWYQPYVISGSLAIFLIYFCILREENDIDEKLMGNLYDHVDGLEEMQLSMAYKYNKENGLSTKDLEARLTELGIDVQQLDAVMQKK